MSTVNPIPEGYHTVTPYLVVKGANNLITFLKQAFDAKVLVRMDRENGEVMHAEINIGDSRIMVSDASVQYAPTISNIFLYVPDADGTYKKAINAGATSAMEPADQFYGDRMGGVKDQFGNQWWIGTHVEDVTPEEMKRRQNDMGQGQQQAG